MVQGKWNITIKTPMGDKSGVLELKVSDKTLTGSLSDAEHHVAISDGRVEGNKLSWKAKITKPMRLSFKFTAIVEQDRINGDARHLLGTAAFSGTRAEEPAQSMGA
ncbi:MAG: hypothetical protein M3N91_16945 [Pseudomonadota bacterium]|nr:hypothetical protein [Pseudomonadota bacterium]